MQTAHIRVTSQENVVFAGIHLYWIQTGLFNEYIITKTRPCNILQFFTAVKNDNFQNKNCDVFLFLLKTLIVGTR